MINQLNDKYNEIKANPFGILITLRNAILIFCKLLSIGLFSYYIIKVHEYEVKWTLLDYFLPNVIKRFNDILTYFGTMILIIPLSLIVTSFFHESRILHLFATWFSFGGSLFAVFYGLFNRTLLDHINLKFFTITHLLTLEEKYIIFVREYTLIANALGNTIAAKTTFILDRLATCYKATYEDELLKMKTLDEIYDYAFGLCTMFSQKYDALHPVTVKVTKQAWSIFDHFSVGTVTVGVIIIISLVGTIYYFGFSGNNVVRQLGESQATVNHAIGAIADNNTAALGVVGGTLNAAGHGIQNLGTALSVQAATTSNVMQELSTQVTKNTADIQLNANGFLTLCKLFYDASVATGTAAVTAKQRLLDFTRNLAKNVEPID